MAMSIKPQGHTEASEVEHCTKVPSQPEASNLFSWALPGTKGRGVLSGAESAGAGGYPPDPVALWSGLNQ